MNRSSERSGRPNLSGNRSTAALNEKRTTFLSPPKSPLSITSIGSPLQAILKSQTKKLFNTVSGGEKFLTEYTSISPGDANLFVKTDEGINREIDVDYELVFKTLVQKLGYLETSIKNLIVSSGKVATLFVNFTNEEELALKVYESDKKSLESTLMNFKSFVSYTYENIKSLPVMDRSHSHDALHKKGKFFLIFY